MKFPAATSNKKFLTAVSITAVFIFLGIVFITTYPKKPASNNNFVSPQKEEPFITGFKFTEYDAGNRSFTVSAERFFVRNKLVRPLGFRIGLAKSMELEDVEVIFYKEGKPVSRLMSKTAIMDTKDKDIIFEGRPALVTENTKILTARKFIWNNHQKRILAKGGCILSKEGKRIQGDAINTDVELRDFRVRDEREKIKI